WLAAEDTPESLGGARVRVLKDEALRTRIAEGGHQFVLARHDRRVAAAQLCDSYVRLLQSTRRWNEIAQRPSADVGRLLERHEPAPSSMNPLETELNAYA